ncbi:helix-turn-helix domain-containing protein [Actinoplanes sp. NPDC051851]|uniref:AraC-like ligand-binding domain-containing protein n=1 Tax=Actinoplanes sp. NPDC051851 TaxID=3154753 RepID=UPI00341B6767
MIDVVRTDRFEDWCQAVTEAFVPLDASRRDGGPFHGELRGATLGALRLYQVEAGSHRVRRTSRLIAAERGDYYKLGLQCRGGSVLSQDGRSVALRPGDFSVYDTTRPYTFTFDDPCRLLVLIFPRALLGLPAAGVGRLTATRFSGAGGLGGLISSFLTRAAEVLDDVDERDAHRLGGNVLDLLTTGLAGHLETRPADPDVARRALFTRAVAYVDTHLGEPGLTPGVIAAVLHISPRYLYKLFQSEGVTVASWVRRRRLEACGRDLRDPLLASCPVSLIGARRGLTDAAHFSRLFHAAYGLSPRDYRARQALCAQGQDVRPFLPGPWRGGTDGRPGGADHRR